MIVKFTSAGRAIGDASCFNLNGSSASGWVRQGVASRRLKRSDYHLGSALIITRANHRTKRGDDLLTNALLKLLLFLAEPFSGTRERGVARPQLDQDAMT
jgi:hypothetical protein